MLVLTRQTHDADKSVIHIGSDIQVTVIEVRGEQARLGITAPAGVAVHRQEVWLNIQAETDRVDR